MSNNTYESHLYNGYRIRIEVDEWQESPRKHFDYMGTIVCTDRRHDLSDDKWSDFAKRRGYTSYEDAMGYLESGEGYLDTFSARVLDAPWDKETYPSVLRKLDEDGYENVRLDTLHRWLIKRVEAQRVAFIKDKYAILDISTGYQASSISCSEFEGDESGDGVIYCTLDEARSHYGVPKSHTWDTVMGLGPWEGKTFKQAALEILELEIKDFNSYLRGEVYSYFIERRLEDIDDDDLDPDDDGQWNDSWIDSCGGFIGQQGVKDAIEQAETSIDYEIELRKKEAEQVAYEQSRIDRIWHI